jgi:hypothetical protein
VCLKTKQVNHIKNLLKDEKKNIKGEKIFTKEAMKQETERDVDVENWNSSDCRAFKTLISLNHAAICTQTVFFIKLH